MTVFGVVGLVMTCASMMSGPARVPKVSAADHDRPATTAPKRESAAQKAQRDAARSVALANLPAQLPQLRAELDDAIAVAEKAKNVDDELEAFDAKLDRVGGKVEKLRAAVGKGSSPELDGLARDVAATQTLMIAVRIARAHMAMQSPKTATKVVRSLIDAEDWNGAVSWCDGALSAFASAQDARSKASWAGRFLPPQRTTESTAHELQRLRERAAAGLQALRELASRCGAAPQVSQWDGELVGLEAHIEETANDPDSIDVENCTKPRLHKKLCWISECDVRGKNAFGALILRQLSFAYAQGTFVDLD